MGTRSAQIIKYSTMSRWYAYFLIFQNPRNNYRSKQKAPENQHGSVFDPLCHPKKNNPARCGAGRYQGDTWTPNNFILFPIVAMWRANQSCAAARSALWLFVNSFSITNPAFPQLPSTPITMRPFFGCHGNQLQAYRLVYIHLYQFMRHWKFRSHLA